MTLETFVQLNGPIIQFAYGLSFFVMGLAIALQSRTSSRLELARSLAWMAAFGIVHSLYAWGELFSYVNEAYLSPRGILILHVIHLFLLAVSFGCLFQFGIALLRPLHEGQWLRWVAGVWFAFYLIFALGYLPLVINDPGVWHNTADALARYTIGFPGGLLAAYGLREQTYRHIAPLNAPHIVSTLRYTGIALAVFALVAGLLPPAVDFFPGDVLNTPNFETWTGIPVLIFLSLIGLVLVITVIRALEIFQVETQQRIEAMEQQQILSAERERIGRELHDGTMQTAYTVGLLVDSARKLAEPGSPIAERLDRAVLVLDEVISDLRRQLGELRDLPAGENLSTALATVAQDVRFRSLVDVSLDIRIDSEVRLPPRSTAHVLAVVNEALSNVLRHAQATRVNITLEQVDRHLRLVIHDNGQGISDHPKEGHGLRNMQERARLLGGALAIQGKNGRGTTLQLEFPYS